MTTASAPWLTVEDVAAQLNCSAETVRRAVRRGHLRALRYGGLWRIDPAERDAFIAKHMSAPKP